MKIFHYHPESGVFLGEGMADESPLEPGVWLIPASATSEEPPIPPDGYQAVFNGITWSTEPVPEPKPDVPAPPPTPPTPIPEAMTTEERLALYGFTVEELRALMLGSEVTP